MIRGIPGSDDWKKQKAILQGLADRDASHMNRHGKMVKVKDTLAEIELAEKAYAGQQKEQARERDLNIAAAVGSGRISKIHIVDAPTYEEALKIYKERLAARDQIRAEKKATKP